MWNDVYGYAREILELMLGYECTMDVYLPMYTYVWFNMSCVYLCLVCSVLECHDEELHVHTWVLRVYFHYVATSTSTNDIFSECGRLKYVVYYANGGGRKTF